MLKIAPPIQAPTPEALAELLKAVETGNLANGPAFLWDPVRHLFLLVFVEHGVIVHWQIEPARDQAAAAELQQRYVHAAMAAMHVAAAAIAADAILPAARAIAEVKGGRVDH